MLNSEKLTSEKPSITCFVCDWTGYDEEFSEIRSRKAFSNVKVVSLPCLGRLDAVTIFDAYLKGQDGILMVGCAPPDCHFMTGSIYSQHTAKVAKKLLDMSGLSSKRLEIRQVSPVDGTELVNLITGFAKKLKQLERSPLADEGINSDVYQKMLAARSAAASFRLRALTGKEHQLTDDANAYNEKIAEEDFEVFLDRTIQDEFQRQRIMFSAEKKPVSVKELSLSLAIEPNLVLRHILSLRRQGMISIDHVEGTSPMYRTMEAR